METQEIIETMKSRPVTRRELCVWLTSSDRGARRWIAELKKNYPVISTSKQRGYKIATTAEDLALVEDSIRNNRDKAISIFEGCTQLKKFLAKYGAADDGQLTIQF